VSPGTAGVSLVRSLFVGLVVLLGLVLPVRSAFALEVPALRARVNDYANLLPADAEKRLEDRLSAFEQKTGNQFAVLTIESLEGDPLEDFSIRVVESWKLGEKKQDNGLLLLVVKRDRKVRVETGYGLEGSITDAVSSRVIRNVIAPAFRGGDYAGGIGQAMESLKTVASGGKLDLPEAAARPAQRQRKRGFDPGILLFVIFLIPLLLPLFSRGRRFGRGGGGFYGGYYGGGFGGGSFGGGGGGGFGGGGFGGGGGGSFGGGGASGNW
jgi:uncharacterized protein